MNLRKAAEMALWALEDIFGKEKKDVGAINALRETLAQPRWVGLTDDDIWEVFKQYDSMQYVAFSKAIEARLKEKNGG